MSPDTQGAPWVRTRLRTAPLAAVAFGALVLVTAFLAALLPRAVEAYGTQGLRAAVAAAPAQSTVLELTAPQPGLELPREAREDAVRPGVLAAVAARASASLPEPLRADPAESAYGVRTAKSLEAQEAALPRPDGLPPRFTLLTQSGLAGHAAVREGRLPAAHGAVTTGTRTLEGAVTVETARTLRLRIGSTVTLAGFTDAPLTVRITGILAPRHPGRGYWSVEPTLRAPALAYVKGSPPRFYWEAGLLLAPGAAPALLGGGGQPEKYWRIAPATGRLTARDAPALVEAVASLEGGPALLRLRGAAGPTARLSTGLEQVVGSSTAVREAITPVVAVAAFGIAAVAVVVLLMSAALAAARRERELALLRARGGSLTGIAGRLLGETAVVAVPSAAGGLLLAVLAVDGARLLPAVLGAGAVAVLACAALPVRALVAHRSPRAHQGRAHRHARPGARRTVAELTVLVLAVGSVAALRRRGTGTTGDLLVSAAPVLVGLVAALILVRLYPLPLRWAARRAARLRGAVGFLALARAGRSPAAVAALPLLALLTALTTAAFGGSVLSGVADARDRAALLTTGADARIATTDGTRFPAGLARAVRGVAGVREVADVRFERAATSASDETHPLTVVGVEPDAYAGLARRVGLGGFPAGRLSSSGGVLDAVASPGVAGRLGRAPRRIVTPDGTVTVRITAVRSRTPAVPDGEFLLVDTAGLPGSGGPTTLLAAGAGLDADALRAAVRGADLTVTLRSQERAALSDTPLQEGAGRIYGWAVVAGAGYAVLALLLSLLRSAPERAALLARLRTLGLTTRQGRRLLGLEALPQALVAAGGAVAVGWATVVLLAPGIDLDRLALPAGAGVAGATLRTDPWSLVLPAAGAVLLSGAVALAQAWWAGRRTPITHLRAGDMR